MKLLRPLLLAILLAATFFYFTTWRSSPLRLTKWIARPNKVEITEAAGGTYFTNTSTDGPNAYGIEDGGVIIHELGVVRMGNNPKTSALNGFCQSHDVKNVFVTDAASFVSNPDKNPTLTIMALTWRASEYLMDEARKGNL